ncbi:MAG: sensor histidine kinase, partial [Desulfomonilaceae bacterium]
MKSDLLRSNQNPENNIEPEQLQKALVEYLYYQGLPGIRGSLLAAVIMSVALWNDVSNLNLIVWFTCYAISCGIGEALVWAFHRAQRRGEPVLPWGRRFAALSTWGGLLWGATVVFLWPADSMFHQAMLTFVVGGMSIGITSSHTAVKEAYLPFIPAVYIPLIGRFFYEGGEVPIAMAFLLVVFMVYLLWSAHRMEMTIIESLKLRFRNHGLMETLTREKTEAVRLNETLRNEISERERAEVALHESEARYRAIVHDQTEFICRFLPDRTLSFVNEACCRFIGKKSEDLIGHSLIRFVPDADQGGLEHHLASISRFNPVATLEHRVVTPSGQIRWVQWTNRAIFDDEGALIAYQAVGRDIDDRKRAEGELKASLREKEVLLREIHHRVKNNLQVISSLLRLQSRYVTHTPSRQLFEASQSRLQSMALIHEKLYTSGNLTDIDFKGYIESLGARLLASSTVPGSQIKLQTEIGAVPVGIDVAVPCGLISNELISNSLKHAFPGQKEGVIGVSFVSYSHEFELVVRDDGVGLPENLDLENAQTLGLRLVNTLVQQLQGHMKVNNADGTEFRIRFPAGTPRRADKEAPLANSPVSMST